MGLTESLADAKARRAAIIDRLSMGESQEIEREAVKMRYVLTVLAGGLLLIAITLRVRKSNGI